MRKEHRLDHDLDERVEDALITGHAGIPLTMELFRASGAAGVMDEQVQIKQRARTLSVSQMAESLFAPWSVGGPVKDQALRRSLGHPIAPATTVRNLLERFHSAEPGSAWVERLELSAARLGTGAHPVDTATLGVDGSIHETHKRSALASCEATPGHQPVTGLWAQKDLVVSEEFRDGNMPSRTENVRVLCTALEQLPAGVTRRYVRGDAGLCEHELLLNLDQEKVGYAISASMSRKPAAQSGQLPERWRLAQARPVPRPSPAIRIFKTQGALFADASDPRHFAMVTNLGWAGDTITGWHRENAST